jgi:hypothetical protein
VRERAHAHQSDHAPVAAADDAPKRAGRDELGCAEDDAEPPEEAGEGVSVMRADVVSRHAEPLPGGARF